MAPRPRGPEEAGDRRSPLAWRHGLRARIASAVLAAVLAPTAVLGWAGYSTTKLLRHRLVEERLALARAVAHQTEQELRQVLEALAAVPPLSAPGEAGPRQVEAMREARARVRHLDAVLLIGPDGRTISREPTTSSRSVREPGPTAVGAAAEARGRSLVRVVDGEGEHGVVVAALPLRDTRGLPAGAVLGVWEVQAPACVASLRALAPSAPATIDVLDETGRVAASTDPSRAGRPVGPARPEPVAPGRKVSARVLEEAAGVEMAVWAPLDITSCGVLVSEPESSFFAAVREARRPWFVLATLLPLAGLVIALGTAWSVRTPIARLEAAAREIAAGDLRHPLPALGDDEIGELGRSFESMRRALGESMDALTRANREMEGRVEERTHELRRLYAELSRKDEQRGRLLRRLLTAEEEERKRIARELHDETCQTIAALGVKLDLLAREPETAEALTKIAEAKSLADRSLDELHRVIFDLRPSVLDDLGLEAAIRWYVQRDLSPAGIQAHVEFDVFAAKLPPDIELGLFRAIQETLHNVARHAGAERVWVQVAVREGWVVADVEDDGRGFDPSSVGVPRADGAGLGLLGIRERMQALGGEARVESAPGKGTRVTLRAPLAPIEEAEGV